MPIRERFNITQSISHLSFPPWVKFNNDDPFCVYHYNEIGNLESITYTGWLSPWEDPADPCLGTNNRGLTLLCLGVGITIGAAASLGTYVVLIRKRPWSRNGVYMLTAAMSSMLAVALDFVSAAHFGQFGGHPSLTHLPKLLYYTAVALCLHMQSFRAHFLAIGHSWNAKTAERAIYAMSIVTLAAWVCGAASLFDGLINGKENAFVWYTIPWVAYLAFVAAVDTGLSIAIVHLCTKQIGILASFDSMTVMQVSSLSKQNIVAAVLQLCGDVIFAAMFLVSKREYMGYTFGYIMVTGIPLQMLFLVYSIYVVQKALTLNVNALVITAATKTVGAGRQGESKVLADTQSPTNEIVAGKEMETQGCMVEMHAITEE
ncbi:hypothetical protein HDU85_001443 [Gaertneriomyces sp. JEL0708]|nr:hypothetical protein HDU85_001443 [Gaertneriomyces sp. JEL0708]